MDAVLNDLESRIEELVKAYQQAKKSESELVARLEKLESKIESDSDLGQRVAELEKQREDLGK